MYACDGNWWDSYYNQHAKDNFGGEFWTQDIDASKRYGLNYVKSHPGNNFIHTPMEIGQGCNSGFQAINLAYHFGAKRVILLGYDMSNQGRWHEDHPKPCGNSYIHSQFERNFHEMKPPIEVINCSRYTELTAFPRANLEDVIKTIDL